VITRVRDTRMGAHLALRLTSHGDTRHYGLTLAIDRFRRQVNDFLVRVESDLEVWTPSAGVALGWLEGSTLVAVGGGVSASGPYATLPNPDSMGTVYRQFLAPALSRDASRSITYAAWLGARHHVTEFLAVQGSARWNGVRVRREPAPFAPAGRRYDQFVVELAVVVGR
jgi:hypothetical protein